MNLCWPEDFTYLPSFVSFFLVHLSDTATVLEFSRFKVIGTCRSMSLLKASLIHQQKTVAF